MKRYRYSGKPAEVTSANGVSGVLIRTSEGLRFRVYDENHDFIDYHINHDDLSVTIDPDALASFYTDGTHYSLDHSPGVLGLEALPKDE